MYRQLLHRVEGDLGDEESDIGIIPIVRRTDRGAITEEAVSSGPTFGFAPEVASPPGRVRRRFTRPVGRALINPENGRDQVDEIANSIFGTRYRARRAEAEGMFEGARNPNIIYSYPPDTPDEYLRTNAALRGLVLGQEAQAWMQRVPRGTPGAQPGYIVRLAGGGPVTPAVYAEIEHIVRSDPRFAPYGGSTLHDGTIIFQNFTGGDEAAYLAGLRELLGKAGPDLHISRGTFTGGYLDGPRDFLRAIGPRPDALRRAAHLLRTKLAPLYERAAREHGGNPAATVERVRQTAAALGRAADALDAGGTVEDAQATFSRVLFNGAPLCSPCLFLPIERSAPATARVVRKRFRARRPLVADVVGAAYIRVQSIGFGRAALLRVHGGATGGRPDALLWPRLARLRRPLALDLGRGKRRRGKGTGRARAGRGVARRLPQRWPVSLSPEPHACVTALSSFAPPTPLHDQILGACPSNTCLRPRPLCSRPPRSPPAAPSSTTPPSSWALSSPELLPSTSRGASAPT